MAKLPNPKKMPPDRPEWEAMKTRDGRDAMFRWLEYQLDRQLDAEVAEWQSQSESNHAAMLETWADEEKQRADECAQERTQRDALIAKTDSGTATPTEKRQLERLLGLRSKRGRGAPRKTPNQRLTEHSMQFLSDVVVPKMKRLWRQHFGWKGRGHTEYLSEFAVRYYWGDEDTRIDGKVFRDFVDELEARRLNRGPNSKRAVVPVSRP